MDKDELRPRLEDRFKDLPQALTPQHVADVMGVKASEVRNMLVERRIVGAYKLPGSIHWRIDKDLFIDFFADLLLSGGSENTPANPSPDERTLGEVTQS